MRLLIVCGAGLALAGCDMGSQAVELERCVFDSPNATLAEIPNASARLEDGAIMFTDENGQTIRHVSYGAGILVCVEGPEG